MEMLIFSILVVILAGCAAPAEEPVTNPRTATSNSNIPDLGAALELTNEIWLNTDTPLRLANLQGKVVLLDMWTFG